MFKNYQQNQGQLLPQSLNDSISADHTARLINQVIDEMDLSFIESKYSALGQKAYNPKMLFKVLVYGYTIGVRSSRKIADRLNGRYPKSLTLSPCVPTIRTYEKIV